MHWEGFVLFTYVGVHACLPGVHVYVHVHVCGPSWQLFVFARRQFHG